MIILLIKRLRSLLIFYWKYYQLRNEKSNELFQPCLAGVRLNFEKKDVERIINAEIDGQLVFSNYGAVSRRETGLLNPPDLADSAIQF